LIFLKAERDCLSAEVVTAASAICAAKTKMDFASVKLDRVRVAIEALEEISKPVVIPLSQEVNNDGSG